MAWEYKQTTGQLTHNGTVVGSGYSGRGSTKELGRNNPKLEYKADTGPIPAGQWQIGKAFDHGKKGPVVMKLAPVNHIPYYRTDFLIHGDNNTNDASQGCIILPRHIRKAIAESKDKELIVVP